MAEGIPRQTSEEAVEREAVGETPPLAGQASTFTESAAQNDESQPDEQEDLVLTTAEQVDAWLFDVDDYERHMQKNLAIPEQNSVASQSKLDYYRTLEAFMTRYSDWNSAVNEGRRRLMFEELKKQKKALDKAYALVLASVPPKGYEILLEGKGPAYDEYVKNARGTPDTTLSKMARLGRSSMHYGGEGLRGLGGGVSERMQPKNRLYPQDPSEVYPTLNEDQIQAIASMPDFRERRREVSLELARFVEEAQYNEKPNDALKALAKAIGQYTGNTRWYEVEPNATRGKVYDFDTVSQVLYGLARQRSPGNFDPNTLPNVGGIRRAAKQLYEKKHAYALQSMLRAPTGQGGASQAEHEEVNPDTPEVRNPRDEEVSSEVVVAWMGSAQKQAEQVRALDANIKRWLHKPILRFDERLTHFNAMLETMQDADGHVLPKQVPGNWEKLVEAKEELDAAFAQVEKYLAVYKKEAKAKGWEPSESESAVDAIEGGFINGALSEWDIERWNREVKHYQTYIDGRRKYFTGAVAKRNLAVFDEKLKVFDRVLQETPPDSEALAAYKKMLDALFISLEKNLTKHKIPPLVKERWVIPNEGKEANEFKRRISLIVKDVAERDRLEYATANDSLLLLSNDLDSVLRGKQWVETIEGTNETKVYEGSAVLLFLKNLSKEPHQRAFDEKDIPEWGGVRKLVSKLNARKQSPPKTTP